METAKLCYVDSETAAPEVYFTTAPLTGEHGQWGDDWNDAPYEHNAGSPYTWYESVQYPKPEYDVYVMRIWKGELSDAASLFGHHGNSWISVRDINELEKPWLMGKGIAIWAGCTVTEFKELLEKAGGKVIEELKLVPRR